MGGLLRSDPDPTFARNRVPSMRGIEYHPGDKRKTPGHPILSNFCEIDPGFLLAFVTGGMIFIREHARREHGQTQAKE